MRLLYLTLLLVSSLGATAQCLTDFSKLLPEPTPDITQSFGRISMYDNYLAIGLPDYDSLGRLAGIVKIYEKSGNDWRIIATLAPSDPNDVLQFGSAVKLSSNYLLVAGGSYAKKVYLFKKPVSGWQSQTELTSFSSPSGQLFGVPYQNQNTMAIADDEQTIAIADPFYFVNGQQWSGAVFVYHKNIGDEWNGLITPVMINDPEQEAMDFGRAGVAIQGDRVISGTPFAPTGNGRLYVYRDPSGEFLDLQLEAKLSAYSSAKTAGLGMTAFAVTSDGIFTTIGYGLDTNAPKTAVAFYEMPAVGSWQDSDYTCVFPFHPEPINADSYASIATNGNAIVVSSRETGGAKTGYTTLLKKGLSGWCDPVRELVDISALQPGQYDSNYGSINSINQNDDIAVGVLPHPNVAGSNLALKILSENLSGEWQGKLLASSKKSTANHLYGNAILGFGDYLFVGASRDGTVKTSGGAVYVYKKHANTWTQYGKVLAPIVDRFDSGFGSALATNGTQLAVGAAGFGEHGRVFIYGQKNGDWSEPQLLQEIELPEDILTVYAYGDNLAMNDEWLLIPYVQNAPARILLAAYRYDGNQWKYNQVVEIGMGNIFAKSTTLAVAIEDNTIVAGNSILELDTQGIWRAKYFLSPSDPEPMQIAPDFSHWITNGSSFGQSVAISNNTIFIGAPTKDNGPTWDVGAIYVYTKKPEESWSNRTESVKILPRIKNERELFGYSIKAFGNTLIAGAPGADYNKDGSGRNKPGRVYIFQTKDYFWNTVEPLLDLTGDSFVKDYFGMAVNLDETDFFISAPIEDIETGKLSGSVYVTPAPPIVKLVPPVCSSNETIELFGYPFGGIWSGPGLIDAAHGIFDPKVAGVGTHEFTYTTESCTYLGRLRITVEEPIVPTILGKQENLVCPQSAVQVSLAVEAKNGYQYQWYHRDDPEEPFSLLDQTQPSMTATKKGEYQMRMSNAVCTSISSTITIKDDTVELQLKPLGRICSDTPGGIILSATPDGGRWSGSAVTTDGKWMTNTLVNNTYTLTYQYTSPSQCSYQKNISYQLNRLVTPAIERLTGNLCVEGKVQLGITIASRENGVGYSWVRNDPVDGSTTDLGNHNTTTANSRGIYKVTASAGPCKVESNELVLNDNSFPLEMIPREQIIAICQHDPFELMINSSGESQYEWYKAENETDEGHRILQQTDNSLSITESGYYYAIVSSGICEQISPRKQITIRPGDEISIPNVFTPNGDSYNDFFEVSTTTEIEGYEICNRYGKTVFSGRPDEKWNGKDVPSGVYYCLVTYRTCVGELKTVKSYVHLMK